MIPKKLVIEQTHTLEQALDKLPTYPKAIELWARRCPNLRAWKDDPMEEDVWLNPDDQGRELAPEQALPDNFELIGLWEYDIHAQVAKQSFVPQKNIVTSAAAVRVVSNWGNASQSCLHKLQLFGEKVDLWNADSHSDT